MGRAPGSGLASGSGNPQAGPVPAFLDAQWPRWSYSNLVASSFQQEISCPETW